MTDPISDMLTRIRNASRALLPAVEMPHSRMKESLANILEQEGYVAEVAVEGKPLKNLKIQLKYQGKKSVIEGLAPHQQARSAPLRGRDGNSAGAQRPRGGRSFHLGGRDDRHAGPQEKPGRRAALLRLVEFDLCRELENNRLPSRRRSRWR